jgi:hypothetical protein
MENTATPKDVVEALDLRAFREYLASCSPRWSAQTGHVCRCPVALYLFDTFRAKGVLVDPEAVVVLWEDREVRIRTPDWARDFIGAIDAYATAEGLRRTIGKRTALREVERLIARYESEEWLAPPTTRRAAREKED